MGTSSSRLSTAPRGSGGIPRSSQQPPITTATSPTGAATATATTQNGQTAPPQRAGSSEGPPNSAHSGASIAGVVGRTSNSRHSVRDVLAVLMRGGSVSGNNSKTMSEGGAGQTQSGYQGRTGESEGHNLWCIVKAKTRQHNSTRIITQKAWFEAKPNATLTIGRQEDCDLKLEDDRCTAINARLVASADAMSISLVAEGRMYRLIGIGNKTCNTTTMLVKGSVIKVGSVSLEVIDMCTEQGDNFTERFGSELRAVNDAIAATAAAAGRMKSASTSTAGDALRTASDMNEGGGGGIHKHDGGGGASDGEDSGGGGGGGGADSHDDDAGSKVIDNTEDDAPAEICYICWGGPDDPLAPEELNAVRKKGERKSEVDKRIAEGVDAGGEKSPNPLIRNPCGKCSGSSRYVHLQCILTWIKSSGSGHCSICNGALPTHFSSPPPNIELKVVRHRRGQSWHGSRRFRLSFVDKDRIVIGRESESDVKLNDRSVDPRHASISFDREKKQFFIKDLESTQGTYIQLTGQMELSEAEGTYLKIGRTTLTLKLTHKRNSIIRTYLPSLTGARG